MIAEIDLEIAEVRQAIVDLTAPGDGAVTAEKLQVEMLRIAVAERAPAVHRGSVVQVVLDLLASSPKVTFPEIMEALGDARNPATHSSVASTLSRMVTRGLIRKAGRGAWGRAPTGDRTIRVYARKTV
jgi:hypothetical protein